MSAETPARRTMAALLGIVINGLCSAAAIVGPLFVIAYLNFYEEMPIDIDEVLLLFVWFFAFLVLGAILKYILANE